MKNSEINRERPNGVEVSYFESGDRRVARYVTDTTVREEALENGRLIGLYWSASGQVQRENISQTLPKINPWHRPIHVFELEIDGQSLHNRWDWISASERPALKPGTVESVVELKHQVRPVSVKVVTRLDGSPILTRWLEISNTGSQPAAISRVAPWSGMLWDTETDWNPSIEPSQKTSKFSLGYLASEEFGKEGNFIWQTLPPEHFRIERRMGRSHGSPYFILRNEVTGELCFMAIAWSGNYFADFAYRSEKYLSFEAGPLGPSPLRIIEPGETVSSPEIHLGMLHSDMDSAVHAWHKHIRASVVPPRPIGREMFTVGNRCVEHPGDWMLKEIDLAAEMGVEAFMVDAGWYGDEFSKWWELRGDWYEGNWLPGGMSGIRDRVKSKGMLFGVWIEPEMMYEKSRLYKEHPEYALRTDGDRPVGNTCLNLADPAVAKYMEDSIVHVVKDFGVDFYKLDYNIETYEGGQNLKDGYLENHAWRHFEVLYRVHDRILNEHPKVVMENCSSGGGRNDLGMLSRFHYACESDMSTHPLAIRAISALSLFLPPEAICYYHNHVHYAHQTADLDTHLRVTLFTSPVFVGFGAQDADRNTAYFLKTKRYIELTKTFCRPIMANRPVVYHHTPDIGLLNPADWCVLEYALSDRTQAYAGIFKLNKTGPNEYIFRPRGIDPALYYDVTLDNRHSTIRVSGWELTNSGVRVNLDGALTSELLLFKVVE